MGNGCAERPVSGLDRVDMNPLVIAGGIGKLIDTRLIDTNRGRWAELPTDKVKLILGGVSDKCGHKRLQMNRASLSSLCPFTESLYHSLVRSHYAIGAIMGLE